MQVDKLQSLYEATGVMPQALADAPRLDATAEEMVSAFQILASRRSAGFDGPNPIQLSEILAYVDLFGPPSVGLEIFEALLREMDLESLKKSSGTAPSNS